MPYEERKTKSGVTVTNKDTGRSFHASSEAAANRDEKLREAFKHIRESGAIGPIKGK